MALLDRKSILEAADVGWREVDVPEWGGSVRVRAMTGAERDAFEASVIEVDEQGLRQFDQRDVRAKLAALTIVDESGQRLFSEQDVRLLSAKSAKALDRVYDAATKLSGMTKKDREALEGNSEGRRDDSSTDSRWPADERMSTASPVSSVPER